jgi:hypothetical protein
MTKLTPEELEELNEARRKKSERQAEEERRAIEEAESTLQEICEQQADTRQQAKLVSVVQALYIEIDKLAKKAPREPVSDLTVEMTNRAIFAL